MMASLSPCKAVKIKISAKSGIEISKVEVKDARMATMKAIVDKAGVEVSAQIKMVDSRLACMAHKTMTLIGGRPLHKNKRT